MLTNQRHWSPIHRETKGLRRPGLLLRQSPQSQEHARPIDGLLRLQDLHDLEQPQALVLQQDHDSASLGQQQHNAEFPPGQRYQWLYRPRPQPRAQQESESESARPQQGTGDRAGRRDASQLFRESLISDWFESPNVCVARGVIVSQSCRTTGIPGDSVVVNKICEIRAWLLARVVGANFISLRRLFGERRLRLSCSERMRELIL